MRSHALAFPLLVLSLLVSFLVHGCATQKNQVKVQESPSVPAAEGKLTVTQDENLNTVVNLEVEHLAKPGEIAPDKSVYVVWAEEPDGETINLGQLVVDDDLKGQFIGVTPHQRLQLLVTAEDWPNAEYPSNDVVMRTPVFDAVEQP